MAGLLVSGLSRLFRRATTLDKHQATSPSPSSPQPQVTTTQSAAPESVPLESTPRELTPPQTTPSESKAQLSQPLESAPLESTPSESTPSESTPSESKPLGSTSLESKPLTESKLLESKPLSESTSPGSKSSTESKISAEWTSLESKPLTESTLSESKTLTESTPLELKPSTESTSLGSKPSAESTLPESKPPEWPPPQKKPPESATTKSVAPESTPLESTSPELTQPKLKPLEFPPSELKPPDSPQTQPSPLECTLPESSPAESTSPHLKSTQSPTSQSIPSQSIPSQSISAQSKSPLAPPLESTDSTPSESLAPEAKPELIYPPLTPPESLPSKLKPSEPTTLPSSLPELKPLQPISTQSKRAETYEELLAAALSPKHPLHIRHQLPSELINHLLTPETQLVNLSTGELPESHHERVYSIDDITRPPSVSTPVTEALNSCVWCSSLVQTGFDWTAPSTWFIPLDVSLLSLDMLDRHFRMVATLSTPESRAVVLYPAREVIVDAFSLYPPFEDVEPFMKLAGFDVNSVNTLAELSGKHVPQYEQYLNAIHIAILRPTPQAPPAAVDNISEVTSASNDISSQTASTEFDERLPSDCRIVRFELGTSSLPSHLAVPDNQVVVIGSDSCVGCWDPRNSKRMMGRIDLPGVLVADISVGLLAGDVEYKYAVVRGDDIVEWETGWNRCLKEDVKIVADAWRCL